MIFPQPVSRENSGSTRPRYSCVLGRGSVCFAGRLPAFLVLIFIASKAAAGATAFEEVPYFVDQVKEGKLPPITQRLPEDPNVAAFQWPGQVSGRSGGTLTMLMSSAKDTRYIVIYGYALLLTYNAKYNLVPNILESFDVEEGRIFTFHLRNGQKWSDGSPFTTEDFRYWWEDVANNTELSPAGPPANSLVDGEPAEGRGHRQDDDPLHLVEAQCRIPAAARAPARSVHLLARANI